MNKVKIVFWTGTGNTEAMAEMVAKGVREAGGEAFLIPVGEASAEELMEEKGFALGCPAMGSDQLEESEMEPFMDALEKGIGGKKIALFGSYGWGDQGWMQDWEKRVVAAGAEVVNGEGIIVNGEPDKEAEEKCRKAGEALAKL